MSSPRRFLVLGSVNAEVVFEFLVWNSTTEVFDPLDITPAFAGAPGFAEGTFLKPDETQETYPLIDKGLTPQGKASFFSPSGFVDQFGEWEANARVHLPFNPGDQGAGVFPSLPVKFTVERALLNPGSGIVTPATVPIVISIPVPTVVL